MFARLAQTSPIGAERELREEIKSFLALPQTKDSDDIFDPLYEKVLANFKEISDDAADHGIANLALLDESTNKSYKNAVFAVKRQKILELDQSGTFVPLCTRNVFLKCYSPEVGNMMFWSEADSKGYLDAITQTLTDFFCGKNGDDK